MLIVSYILLECSSQVCSILHKYKLSQVYTWETLTFTVSTANLNLAKILDRLYEQFCNHPLEMTVLTKTEWR